MAMQKEQCPVNFAVFCLCPQVHAWNGVMTLIVEITCHPRRKHSLEIILLEQEIMTIVVTEFAVYSLKRFFGNLSWRRACQRDAVLLWSFRSHFLKLLCKEIWKEKHRKAQGALNSCSRVPLNFRKAWTQLKDWKLMEDRVWKICWTVQMLHKLYVRKVVSVLKNWKIIRI